ncbi:unnamed protein product [Didymodactylos carnosus]|uniref:Uncharacterized protein n=1 Tax=Didymodactylos carnosus TaxID=1234261 RepID=A0A815SVJ6_9BILA|nr:unnamed protein product [Didymodactylos carnosus]CAF4357591.1 unnamed protein product [Didymodactylos carnosus]
MRIILGVVYHILVFAQKTKELMADRCDISQRFYALRSVNSNNSSTVVGENANELKGVKTSASSTLCAATAVKRSHSPRIEHAHESNKRSRGEDELSEDTVTVDPGTNTTAAVERKLLDIELIEVTDEELIDFAISMERRHPEFFTPSGALAKKKQ